MSVVLAPDDESNPLRHAGVSMERPIRIVSRWTSSHRALLTVQGRSGEELSRRLDGALERLLHADLHHLVVDLHRLTGNDAEVLELLAATCHRVWARNGVMEIRGLQHRLVSRPEVRAFPEVFGTIEDGDEQVVTDWPGGQRSDDEPDYKEA